MKLRFTYIKRKFCTFERSQSGFTIVELLIVVVILAILAAIFIAGYNGIQNRASRASVASQVNQWEKVFKIFIAETSTRPQGNWDCVGRAEDFPAQGNFPAGSCEIRSTDGGATWVVENDVDTNGALLSDQLAPYITRPAGAYAVTETVSGSTKWQHRGLIYDDDSYGNITLVYTIKGDSCLDGSWYTYTRQDARMCYHRLGSTAGLPIAN